MMRKVILPHLFSLFCVTLLLCALLGSHHAILGLFAPRALPSEEERFFYEEDITYLPRQHVTNGEQGYAAFL